MVLAFAPLLSSGAWAQSAATTCLPGPDGGVRCRTLHDDGSSTVRFYRPNPFGEGYQAETRIQRSTAGDTLPDVGRRKVEPLPPRPPMPPVKIPRAGRTTETWVPPSRPSPSDAFPR